MSEPQHFMDWYEGADFPPNGDGCATPGSGSDICPTAGRVAHFGGMLTNLATLDSLQTAQAYMAALSHWTRRAEFTPAGLSLTVCDVLAPGRKTYRGRPGSLSPFVEECLAGMWHEGRGNLVAERKYGQPGDIIGYCAAAGLALTMTSAAVMGRAMASTFYRSIGWKNLGALVAVVAWHTFRGIKPRKFTNRDRTLGPDWLNTSDVWASFENGFTDATTPFEATPEDAARFLGACLSGSVELSGEDHPLIGLITKVEDVPNADGDLRSALSAMAAVQTLYPEGSWSHMARHSI